MHGVPLTCTAFTSNQWETVSENNFYTLQLKYTKNMIVRYENLTNKNDIEKLATLHSFDCAQSDL